LPKRTLTRRHRHRFDPDQRATLSNRERRLAGSRRPQARYARRQALELLLGSRPTDFCMRRTAGAPGPGRFSRRALAACADLRPARRDRSDRLCGLYLKQGPADREGEARLAAGGLRSRLGRSITIGWRPSALAAQLLHPGADRGKIIGSARSCHVSSVRVFGLDLCSAPLYRHRAKLVTGNRRSPLYVAGGFRIP